MRRTTIWLTLILAWLTIPTAGILAADTIPVKSLAGPPETFADHRFPDAAATGVPSNLLVIDAPKAAAGKAAVPGTTTSTFETQAGSGFSLVQVTTRYPSFSPATLTGPGGIRYVFDGSRITCDGRACGTYQADLLMQPFERMSPGGVAVFSISGGEVTGGTWRMALESPAATAAPEASAPEIEAVIAFDDNVVDVRVEPDPCKLQDVVCTDFEAGRSFDLTDGAAPVLSVAFSGTDAEGAATEAPLRMTGLSLRVTDTEGQRVAFEDDLGSTRTAALPTDRNGNTLVRLPSLPAGSYSVRLDIEGEVDGVGTIQRTAFYYLPIVPKTYRLDGKVRTTLLDDQRLELRLGVDAPRAAGHVFAYAEVWARGGSRPVAWVGGMTHPEATVAGFELPVVLDGRWLAMADATGGDLTLRNVRIQDPDTYVPVDQAASMPVTVDRLPPAAFQRAAAVDLDDDTLYRGHGDRFIPAETHGLPGGDPSRGGPLNQGIFLVHGWCDGPSWPFWDFVVPGRVGGTAVYSDPGGSRSHDNFAQRIRNQGDANFVSAFTVVAHSQGGAAATHLWANYFSLLDNTTAPRRIQSVGTPYGGSTLMDFYLAAGPLAWVIAEILGECGPQFNLGTLGSALWQIGIPGWARDDVFYYRTRHRRPGNFWERLQFWRWRCNFASFLIPSADDGVVADFQGWFPGANSQGITDGECHTGGMNHPDQRDNAGRNDTMDMLGRPAPPAPLTARCQVEHIWHPNGGPTGHGYSEYWVDASGSTPGASPIATYTWFNGGISTGPTTNDRYGPLFPGLPGQAQNYIITVMVTDTSGGTASATCSVP
ncbi:MAG: hypothetical protein AAGN66_04790 [Acidobacteriota bacterium]